MLLYVTCSNIFKYLASGVTVIIFVHMPTASATVAFLNNLVTAYDERV